MKQKSKRDKVIYHSNPLKQHVGIVARDLKKGELISYSPFIDTKDILVNEKKPSGLEVEGAIKTLQKLIKFEHARGSTCITTALCNRLKEAN